VIVSKARATPPPEDPTPQADDSAAPQVSQRYHYLVVPFHGNIRAGQKIGEVSSQLQDIINHYASYGWELVQVGSVSLTVNEGCLAALLGRSSSQLRYDQVVFRQPI